MMKRFLMVLVLSLVFSTSCGLADTAIDWTLYTDDELANTVSELTEMLTGAKTELARRGITTTDEITVPAGVYIIGEDIPAGRWSIKSVSQGFYIKVYNNKADYEANKPDLHKYQPFLSTNEVWNVIFENGEYIDIGEEVIFSPFTSTDLGF